jgi:hypothetical protein
LTVGKIPRVNTDDKRILPPDLGEEYEIEIIYESQLQGESFEKLLRKAR